MSGIGNIILDPDTFKTNIGPVGQYLSISGDVSASGQLIVDYGTQVYTSTTENDTTPPTVISSVNYIAPLHTQN